MLDWANHVFAFVCGQNPEHTSAPGGVWLPCCQRCAGFYVGAFVAMGLHLWRRPGLSGRFLWVHGAFLLLMAPFGFHWLPQGPVLRTVTGVLFGFGAATFLWTPLAAFFKAGAWPKAPQPDSPAFWIMLVMTLAWLPTAASLGGPAAGYTLSVLAFCGLAVVSALVLANAALGLFGAVRLLLRLLCLRQSA